MFWISAFKKRMFSKIVSSTCLSELLFCDLDCKTVRNFIGATSNSDVITSILSSELSASVMIENTNADPVSDQASFLILLSRWAYDLGYDVLNTMESMSLLDYSDNIHLRSVRLCMCGSCAGSSPFTYQDCGPYIEQDLTVLDKIRFLKSVSEECRENIKSVDLITESFYDRKSAMMSLVVSSGYRGLVRLNACGCNTCQGFDVYLELGEVSHVTKSPGGIWLTRLTTDICKMPFVTDYQWLNVFQNVIVVEPNSILEWYKTELPMYSEGLRMILEECGISAADFQKVMADTKYFKKLNQKYGMRKMLKLTITYNMWAEIQDLPRIRTFIYNDKRLLRQASEFLFITGLDKPIHEEAGERGILVKDIKSAVLEVGVIDFPLPVKEEPQVKPMVISEVFTKMMDELEAEDPFECLEKKKPGIKDLYMRTMMDNVERLPLEIEEYNKKTIKTYIEEVEGREMTQDENFEHHCNLKAFNEFSKLTTFRMNNQKKVNEFLKESTGMSMETNEKTLCKDYSMKILPESEFKHEDMAECDDPPAPKPMRSYELARFNNWEKIEQSYAKKGVRIGLKPIYGITTAEEYANEIVKNTSIPLEDALEIYSWNEIIIKERQHRAPRMTVSGPGVCQVYTKRIKRHQLEFPFRVHSELILNEVHIKQEKVKIEWQYEEGKRSYLMKALGVSADPKEEAEFEKPKELNDKLVATDNAAEMERALIPNKGIVLSNKFTKFIRQKFRDSVNPLLEAHGYQINMDYRLEKIGYARESRSTVAGEIAEMVRRLSQYSKFTYDKVMDDYVAEHGGEANPLSNLYDRCVKHFNQTLLKKIRNRRNFSRMVLLTDDDKAKLIVGLACKEYGLIKSVKIEKKLRATEVRKICSKFFRHECFG
jgi:hypothetical protein